MHRHSRLGHKWRKLVRGNYPMLVVILGVALAVLLMAGIIILLTDPRFRAR